MVQRQIEFCPVGITGIRGSHRSRSTGRIGTAVGNFYAAHYLALSIANMNAAFTVNGRLAIFKLVGALAEL